MVFYLTYNDLPSGIYSSQVIDVVNYFNDELKTKTKLVAFISLRSFLLNKKKIRSEIPHAIVIPMFPRLKHWRLNIFALRCICFFHQPKMIIARSVLAGQLALRSKTKKFIYDGRGAIAAEWNEYKVVSDEVLLKQISSLEKEVIQRSDAQIAVSNKLVDYWRENYALEIRNAVVIPCTLNKVFENIEWSEESVLAARKELGFDDKDIVFVYSGTNSGWQSFDLLKNFITDLLKEKKENKFIFLSELNGPLLYLKNEFPTQVIIKKVSPHEVPKYLMASDHGLLIREQSITNKVASPVKFAEYLACGLKVIISENLGDYSHFVNKNKCGSLVGEFKQMERITLEEKKRMRALALSNFTKRNFMQSYNTLLSL